MITIGEPKRPSGLAGLFGGGRVEVSDFDTSDSDSDLDDDSSSSDEDEGAPSKTFTIGRKASIKIKGVYRDSVRIKNPSLRRVTSMRTGSFNVADQRILFRVLLDINESDKHQIDKLLKQPNVQADEKLFGLLSALQMTKEPVFEARDAWKSAEYGVKKQVENVHGVAGMRSKAKRRLRRKKDTQSMLYDQFKEYLRTVRENSTFVTELLKKVMAADESKSAIARNIARKKVITKAVNAVFETMDAKLKDAVQKKLSEKALSQHLATYLTMVVEQEIQALFYNDLVEHINGHYLEKRDGTFMRVDDPEEYKKGRRTLAQVFPMFADVTGTSTSTG